jgi:hypothetical protein
VRGHLAEAPGDVGVLLGRFGVIVPLGIEVDRAPFVQVVIGELAMLQGEVTNLPLVGMHHAGIEVNLALVLVVPAALVDVRVGAEQLACSLTMTTDVFWAELTDRNDMADAALLRVQRRGEAGRRLPAADWLRGKPTLLNNVAMPVSVMPVSGSCSRVNPSPECSCSLP